MPGTSSISGVISGLNTDDIINKLMQLAQKPVNRLQVMNATYSNQLASWQDLNTRMLALKMKADTLADRSTFQGTSFTSSDTDAVTGTSQTTATPGTYFLTVNTLAQTQQLKTQGYADLNSPSLGTGSIAIGAGPDAKAAANCLSGTVSSVTIGTNSTLAAGPQILVIDAVGTSATKEMSGTFLGADADAARNATVSAGNMTINGQSFSFDGSQTLGGVVDTINARTSMTGVTASITGSADNWHITLSNQYHGSDKSIAYTEDASILNGGSSNNYSVAGTDASAHIGSVLFNQGKGDVLQSANGDIICLDASATAGEKANAFTVQGKTSITISDKNNSLAGLALAINNANCGVRATIINDGSSTAPYHLILTSSTSGTAGKIALDTSNLSGGTAPSFTQLQAATDASLTLGSGDGAITVTKGSNNIQDLIPGVNLTLSKADPNKQLQISIGADISGIKQKIQDFVQQYNNMTDALTTQSSWDMQTNSGGVLFGDSRLLTLQTDVRSIASRVATGSNPSFQLLSQIGITSTENDQLVIDDAKLSNALANNLQDVQRLFSTSSDASNPNVTYVASSEKTKPSDAAGYAIKITGLASKARVTSGVAQTSTLAQDEKLTINGVDINLTAGMTQAQVISKINENSTKIGVLASGTQADGTGTGSYLTFTQLTAGSSRHISVLSTVSNGGSTPKADTSGVGAKQVTEISPFGESNTGTSAAGNDIEGTINGEPAKGDGEYLTGCKGNANTEDLKVRVQATAIGDYGKISYCKGVGSFMSDYGATSTDVVNGLFTLAQNGVTAAMTDNNTSIKTLQDHLADQKDRLVEQFTRMESALASLQSQQQYLSSQIASFTKSS